MRKRLYRSRSERMLLGVCGGLAKYFDIDPTIIRLIFVITIFCGGLGIIAYIVLAIITPLESSPATRPEETIRENVQDIKNTAETIGKDIQTTFNKEGAAETVKNASHRGTLILGGVIILIGIIALIATLTSLHVWAVFWPVLLIALGLLILFLRRR
jgi:phage shock protein C